ncbi:MAG: CBS domain-containing protein [Gammaproteobacteria bacterium]|nr:CBS domain-containing protein [Gammaproteobacteria bacterium]
MTDEPPKRGDLLEAWRRQLKKLFGRKLSDRQLLIEQVHLAEQRNVIDTDTAAMMEGALLVCETKVRDIMVPRAEVDFLVEGQSLREYLPALIESGHSRLPMLDDKREKVIGVLLAKDVLPVVAEEGDEAGIAVRDVLRPAIFVPESKRLNILLREFRNNRNHLAIVVDEYGAVAGIVSIEDVIEQIVGDIGDEHDVDDEMPIRRHRNNRYTVRGRTTIEEFNEYFESDLSDEEYDTVGGLVVSGFGYLPIRGEEIAVHGFNFRVLRADKRRVHLLRVLRGDEGAVAGGTDDPDLLHD